MEVKTCTYDLRIVEHHKCTFWQVLRKVEEMVVGDVTMIKDKQFRVVTWCDGELRYALIRQLIVVVTYTDLFCIHFKSFFCRDLLYVCPIQLRWRTYIK